MIGFASIAAESPSDVSGMTRHLMNATISRAQSRLAAYYNRGGVAENQWYDLAERVLAGEITHSEAVDQLMEPWRRTWDRGDADEFYRVREDYDARFMIVIDRIEGGLADAPLAIVRPDIEAGVMIGLGIKPGMILSEDEINCLLAGYRADGQKIEGKHYAVEREMPADPKTGERKWSTPIGSYDFCTEPDKTISIAWALAPPEEQAKIFLAHQQASREAIAYIADEIGVARYGKGGQEGREDGAVAWLEFTHHTGRRVQIVKGRGNNADVDDSGIPGDMHLHTHHLIPNAVFTASGKVGTLDTLGIRGLIKEAGAVYQARLGILLRDAGFDAVRDDKTGSIRLTSVPSYVRDLFSKKTMNGEGLAQLDAAEAGLDWGTMTDAQRAGWIKHSIQRFEEKKRQDGLPSKGAKDDVADFENWRLQAKEAGWTIPDTFQLIGPELRELTKAERHRVAYEMSLPWLDKKFQHEAVLSHFELRRGALYGLVHTGMSGLEDIDAVTKIMRDEGIHVYGQKTAIQWGKEDDGRVTSVSTRLHEDQEQEFMRLMKAAAFDKSGAIQPGLLKHKLDTSGLDFSDDHGKAQRVAIERVGTGGRFGLILAAAGAGKTTALKPLVAAWNEMQRDVWGASLGWRQADDLADAGIKKWRVKAFAVLIDGMQNGSIRLTDNSVVAIDEWGLLGTRQGLELLRHQQKLGFSIVALGDEKQCGPQPLDAKVLTPTGFRPMGSLGVGDLIVTPSGSVSSIVGVHPQGVEQVFRVTFSDGRQTECGARHLWKVWKEQNLYSSGSHATRTVINRGRRYRILPLSEVMSWFDLGLTYASHAAIPLIEPLAVERSVQDLPIPPYALGLLLGDGHFAYGIAHFCSKDDWLVQELQTQLPGYEIVPIIGGTNDISYRLRLRDSSARTVATTAPRVSRSYPYSPLSISLEALGLRGTRSWDKFIPQIYKIGSVAQRLEVIRGLMDTDGNVAVGGTYARFTTVSERLARDVQDVVWSLGGIATIGSRKPALGGVIRGRRVCGQRVCYYVDIRHPDIAQFFALPRKQEKTRPSSTMTRLKIASIEAVALKETRCITIDHPDHLYITDDYIVTHNSIEAGAIIDLSRRALGVDAIPQIHTTVRQVGREARISRLLRDGEARQALDMKLNDPDGPTAEMVYGGRDGVIRRTAELYAERLKATGQAPTISAPTNADAHQISVAVRHERRKMGLVGAQDLMTVQATDGTREYSLSLARGDKVRLFESTKATLPDGRVRSIGRNGNVVEVLVADRFGLTVRNKDGKEGLIRWETLRKRAGGRGVKLAYGDSLTIYSAQGSTTKEHIFALPDGSGEITAYTAYSAATRHKERAYLLTSEVAERTAVRLSRPVNSIHDITTADKWANVAKQLSYQPHRDTATAMRERVGKVKIGALDTNIAMHTPADPRLRKRDAPSRAAANGPDIVQQRNLSDIFTSIADTARQVMTRYRERGQGISR